MCGQTLLFIVIAKGAIRVLDVLWRCALQIYILLTYLLTIWQHNITVRAETFDNLGTVPDSSVTGLIHCTQAVQQLMVCLQRQVHSMVNNNKHSMATTTWMSWWQKRSNSLAHANNTVLFKNTMGPSQGGHFPLRINFPDFSRYFKLQLSSCTDCL